MKDDRAQGTAQLFFRLCSDHLSIEAIPKRKIRINFQKMKEQSVENHEVLMWTPHFVILKNQGGQEITLRPDGRMVVRKSTSEAVARQTAAAMLAFVLKSFVL
jgi:hypothetical protein